MRHPMIASTAALTFLTMTTTAGFAQAPGPLAVQTVTVELSSFKFAPATLMLQKGRTYRMHFVNTSSGGHNFVAEEFFASSTIAPEDQGKVAGGKVALHGGEAIDVTLVTGAAATFKSRCTHLMHALFGMKGTIIVQ